MLDYMSEPVVSVADDPERNRYEVWVDGALAGIAAYRPEPGRRVFVHTEIDPAFSGRGLAGTLVRAALDEARAHGVLVTPVCPFVGAFIGDHPEYADLVDDSRE